MHQSRSHIVYGQTVIMYSEYHYIRKDTDMFKTLMDDNVKLLFDAILTLETEEDCLAFFEDLCTVKELTEMSRRLRAAQLLDSNTIYTDIAEQTGLSTATISRVNRCLKYGSDGYTRVLARLAEQKKDGAQ